MKSKKQSKKQVVGSSIAPASTEIDKKLKAESDARTLCEAETIKGDRERMRLAQSAARGMAKDKMIEIMAMQKVAKGKMSEQQKFERTRMKQGAKPY